MVQSILNDMTSDNVNSISDTEESEQVASTIKDTYFNLLNTLDKIPEHKELVQLEALSDSARPNYLKIPDNVTGIDWVKYNVSTDSVKRYTTIDFLEPAEFLDRIYQRNSDATNVQSVTDISGVELLIINDKKPEWYTSFDDEYLVFDSFDSSVDSTLQESKSLSFALVEPTWTTSDTFVPDLDSNLFPLLLAEAKSLCFVNDKDIANPKIEQIARSQKVSLQNNKKRTRDRFSYPNFGRK